MALFSLFGSKHPVEAPTAITDASASMSSTVQMEGNPAETNPAANGPAPLPLIGNRPVGEQQRVLAVVLIVAVILVGLGLAVTLRVASSSAKRLDTTGDALMQSQRVAKSISAALLGSREGFGELKTSAEALNADMQRLSGGATLGGAGSELAKLQPLVNTTVENARAVVKLEPVLTQTNNALRKVNRQSDSLLETTETITSLMLQQNAPAADIAAASQLNMLTQRIGKSANEFLSFEGVSPEAVFALGKDLNTFNDLSKGLLDGDANLQLSAARDPQLRAQLSALAKDFGATRQLATSILANLQGLSSARVAQAAVVKDSVPLLAGLQDLQQQYSSQAGVSMPALLFLVAMALLALLALVGLARLYVQETRQRTLQSELQRQQAERQELEARRTNEANQSAILRLMNELQNVAEGDLTQQATVTEDITGAIADSVNYTVEELRNLVSQVQSTADQVSRASTQAQTTSGNLLKSSEQQLVEIRETGQSVLDMAERINTVSAQAQQSTDVARQSLAAAEQGLQAVRNSIEGMNVIRTQIQDTSKRIKRLGESSQEIGEITELISDLTEQTNVLALNAAIQAASAGDAGRGFSVVAEEVQRLAERSAEAAKQIAALVRAIQTDTQDAVAAMEKSTQGVVEGAKLSDNAGAALAEIDRVSRQLADLIQRISEQTLTEAQSANKVAGNIQHIFAVTEQTSQGTRSTADLVAELARVAEALRESVSRFKIA
ncbi:MAG: type IV pili methyl-accepting chemotaxis transducer N-terminal domain-containing protein [Betaproteobacteria bacterium]|nr:type IV pili methyl-accepting chemotaxis transducer N-terminal domain-containing protein [Betaproteobacteria bacterium]